MLPSTEIRPTRLELSDSSNEPETMATNFSVSSETPQFVNKEKDPRSNITARKRYKTAVVGAVGYDTSENGEMM